MRRSFFVDLLDLTLAVAGVLTIGSAAGAQTTNPELNQLLNQANQVTSQSQELIDQVEVQLQQQEASLSYGCYVLGDKQSCLALQEFYQQQMQGYEAGSQYWQNLQNN